MHENEWGKTHHSIIKIFHTHVFFFVHLGPDLHSIFFVLWLFDSCVRTRTDESANMLSDSAVSGLVYLIVFVSRSSLRTAAEKTSTSAPSAAAASSWPRCCARFSKWASSVSLHQCTPPLLPSVLWLVVPLCLVSLCLLELQSEHSTEHRRNKRAQGSRQQQRYIHFRAHKCKYPYVEIKLGC